MAVRSFYMTSMKYILPVVVIFAVLLSCNERKTPRLPAVASVGNYLITVDEFRERAEFSPFNPSMTDSIIKHNVLQALIAEKMLSQCTTCIKDSVPVGLIERRYKEAVIETFWRRQFADSIRLSDEALWRMYLRMNRQRDVQLLPAASREEAQQLAGVWKSNPALLSHRLRRDTVKYSGELPELEDTLFTAPVKQVMGPLKIGRRFYLFRVEQEWPLYIVSRQDFEQKKRSIAKLVKRARMRNLFSRYMRRVHRKAPYQLNKKRFKTMTRYLENRLLGKSALSVRRQLENTWGEGDTLLHQSLITFEEGGTWSVGAFIRRLSSAPYPIGTDNPAAFRRSIILAARRMADDEILFRDAVKRGYDKDAYVRWQTDMWRSAYRARMAQRMLPADAQKRAQLTDSLSRIFPIHIYKHVLDTVTIHPTRMMVLKRHFPGQTVVPPLLSAGGS